MRSGVFPEQAVCGNTHTRDNTASTEIVSGASRNVAKELYKKGHSRCWRRSSRTDGPYLTESRFGRWVDGQSRRPREVDAEFFSFTRF